MTKTITINEQSVVVKQYKGQMVVTFKDIDLVHNRPTGTAKRNFVANRKHFIEGEDYFIVKPSDIQKNEIRTSEINNRGTILITESGYLMLVKSFTDDLSWEVQRQLVKTYFRAKEQNEHKALPEKPYEYFDKTYNGIPVLTTEDIEQMTGINRSTVDYFMKHKTESGKDYYPLTETELRKFKDENPRIVKFIKRLNVITRSGFMKLCRAYGIKVEEPKCFEAKKEKRDSIKTLNLQQAKELFDKECVLIGDKDVILYSKVVELFGEDAANYSVEIAHTPINPNRNARPGFYFNERDSVRYFTLAGFYNAVSYSNIENISKSN